MPRGHYTSYRRQAPTREEASDHRINTSEMENALWQQIRYGSVRDYHQGEIDFEDMKYDPIQPR